MKKLQIFWVRNFINFKATKLLIQIKSTVQVKKLLENVSLQDMQLN